MYFHFIYTLCINHKGLSRSLNHEHLNILSEKDKKLEMEHAILSLETNIMHLKPV